MSDFNKYCIRLPLLKSSYYPILLAAAEEPLTDPNLAPWDQT